MISFRQKGDFSNTLKYLSSVQRPIKTADLEKYGKQGVVALASATPIETGETANSWRYEVHVTKTYATISFHNDNIQNGVPIAILLQYGHATKNGGWVDGINFINPSIQPIFNKIADDAWGEVTK